MLLFYLPLRLVADKNIKNNKDGRKLENKFSGKNYITLLLLYLYIRILIKYLEKEVSIDENLIEKEDFKYINIFNLKENIISDDINLEENKDFEVVIHQLNQNRG